MGLVYTVLLKDFWFTLSPNIHSSLPCAVLQSTLYTLKNEFFSCLPRHFCLDASTAQRNYLPPQIQEKLFKLQELFFTVTAA